MFQVDRGSELRRVYCLFGCSPPPPFLLYCLYSSPPWLAGLVRLPLGTHATGLVTPFLERSRLASSTPRPASTVGCGLFRPLLEVCSDHPSRFVPTLYCLSYFLAASSARRTPAYASSVACFILPLLYIYILLLLLLLLLLLFFSYLRLRPKPPLCLHCGQAALCVPASGCSSLAFGLTVVVDIRHRLLRHREVHSDPLIPFHSCRSSFSLMLFVLDFWVHRFRFYSVIRLIHRRSLSARCFRLFAICCSRPRLFA